VYPTAHRTCGAPLLTYTPHTHAPRAPAATDTDAGFNVPTLWHKLQVGRDYVYDSTTSRLKTSGMCV